MHVGGSFKLNHLCLDYIGFLFERLWGLSPPAGGRKAHPYKDCRATDHLTWIIGFETMRNV